MFGVRGNMIGVAELLDWPSVLRITPVDDDLVKEKNFAPAGADGEDGALVYNVTNALHNVGA